MKWLFVCLLIAGCTRSVIRESTVVVRIDQIVHQKAVLWCDEIDQMLVTPGSHVHSKNYEDGFFVPVSYDRNQITVGIKDKEDSLALRDMVPGTLVEISYKEYNSIFCTRAELTSIKLIKKNIKTADQKTVNGD